MKSFTFGGIKARDYGICISGEATYPAPERDVELIEVPGRNGAIAQDDGRFKNIDITYPAFIRAGFEDRFERFKSDLMQFTGYQTLTDEYHPEFYREGIFTGPIDPRTGPYNKSGKFDVSFNCKPQRFLVEGAKTLTYWPVNYTSTSGMREIAGITVTPGTVFQVRATYLAGSTLAGDAYVNYYDSNGDSVEVDTISTAGNIINYSGTVPTGAATAKVTYPQGTSYAGATGITIINDGDETRYNDGGPLFVNPFPYAARPVISIYGGIGETISIFQNDPEYRITVEIGDYSSTDYDHITIDSVLGDCYFDGIVGLTRVVADMNPYVTLTQNGDLSNDYPVFIGGPGTVMYTARLGETSPIEKIEVKAGWWTV